MAKRKDLVGQRFGNLTVINFSGKSVPYKASLWECLCDCGKLCIKYGSNLIAQNSNCCSRGCKFCKLRLPNNLSIKRMAFSHHKDGAKRRNLISFLNEEQYFEIAALPCTYCGKFSKRRFYNLKQSSDYSKNNYIDFNSIDRKDNEPYYKLENSQSVCFQCQRMKGALLDKEFREHIQDINIFQRKKDEEEYIQEKRKSYV